MKKLQILIITIFVIALLISCRSSRKAFERGNYQDAVRLSSRELCRNPKRPEEQRNILKESYALAMQDLKNRLQAAQNSNDQMRWEQIGNVYREINDLYSNIMGCPNAVKVIPNPEYYRNELEQANNNAAEVYYQMGLSQLNIGTREAGKQALSNFQRANQLVPNFKPDILQRIEQARLLSIFKVFVEQIPMQSAFSPNDEFFRNQINTHLLSLRRTNTLDFFFNRSALPVPPNQILTFQFFDFIVGENNLKERIETIVGDTVKTNVNGTSVLSVPRTELRTFTKTLRSTAIMEMKIFDQQNQRMILHERIPAEYIWQHQWAVNRGDERALKPAQLALLNVQDKVAPDRQVLFQGLCSNLLEQIKPKLTTFYNNQR
jgi:hypothetical protein